MLVRIKRWGRKFPSLEKPTFQRHSPLFYLNRNRWDRGGKGMERRESPPPTPSATTEDYYYKKKSLRKVGRRKRMARRPPPTVLQAEPCTSASNGDDRKREASAVLPPVTMECSADVPDDGDEMELVAVAAGPDADLGAAVRRGASRAMRAVRSLFLLDWRDVKRAAEEAARRLCSSLVECCCPRTTGGGRGRGRGERSEIRRPDPEAGLLPALLSAARDGFDDRRSVGSCLPALAAVVLLSHLGFGCVSLCVGWLLLEAGHLKSCSESILCRRLGSEVFRAINPAFVVNANMETAGWLNDLVRFVWRDCFRPMVRRHQEDLAAMANEAIRKKLGWMGNHPLLGHVMVTPCVAELDPGPNPPWVTGIKTHYPPERTDETCRPGMFVDVGLMLELRPSVTVSFGRFLSFGVRGFSFCAPVRFALAPVFDEEKMVGDVYLSVLHPPYMDYDLDGLLAFMNFACVKVLLGFVAGIMFKFVQYPYQFRVPVKGFPPNMKEYMFVPTVPRGLVRLKVLRSENVSVVRTPLLSIWLARNRPYNIMSLEEGITEIRNNVRLKRFKDFVSEFPLTKDDMESCLVTIEVINKSLGVCTDSRGDLIPPLKLRLSKLVTQKKRKLAVRLGKKGNAGRLIIFFQFINVERNEPTRSQRLPVSTNPFYSQAILSLIVHQVRSHEPLQSPFVSIVASGCPASTTTLGPPNSICDFSEHFLFPIHNHETDQVTFSLMDRHDRSTGQLTHQRSYIHHIKVESFEVNDIHEPCEGREPRELYYNFGRVSVNIEDFTGYVQVFKLECHPSERHEISVVAKLYFLTT